jgi:hypothetical protein
MAALPDAYISRRLARHLYRYTAMSAAWSAGHWTRDHAARGFAPMISSFAQFPPTSILIMKNRYNEK